MLDNATIRQIMAELESSYGNLENPDFHKVASALARDPYRSLLQSLSASGASVTETTDPNDDVSVQAVVSQAGEQIALELSAIGPFGVVRRLADDGSSQWISKSDETTSPLAARVAGAAERAGVRLLDRDTAAMKVDIRFEPDDTGATLYQALFTNTDVIP
jgi:hypothetical protein